MAIKVKDRRRLWTPERARLDARARARQGLRDRTEVIVAPPAPTNIIEAYTWDAQWWGSDAQIGNPNLIEHLGTTTHDLHTFSGINPPAAFNVSTAGITDAALPAALINNAFEPDAANGGALVTPTFRWLDSDFWLRLIVDLHTVTAGNRTSYYIFNASNFLNMQWSNATAPIFQVRSTIDGLYSAALSIPSETSWLLIDWQMVGAQMSIFINGTDHSPAPHTSSVGFHRPTTDVELALCGRENGNQVAEGAYVFEGIGFGRTVSLGAHQADAIAGGF